MAEIRDFDFDFTYVLKLFHTELADTVAWMLVP